MPGHVQKKKLENARKPNQDGGKYLFRWDNIEHIVFDISRKSLSFAQVETYCADHKYSHAFLQLQPPTYFLLMKENKHVQVEHMSQQGYALVHSLLLDPSTSQFYPSCQ